MPAKRLEPWQKRIRAHIKAHGISPETIAETLGKENASTIRSWLNRTRRIKLDNFLELCKAAGIDAAVALFGGPVMREEHMAALRNITSSLPIVSTPAVKHLPPPKRSGDGEDDDPTPRPQ